MVEKLYSKRNKPEPTSLVYNFDHLVRERILYTLIDVNGGHGSLDGVLSDVATRCVREYGALRGTRSRTGGTTGLEHWRNCSSDEVVDFLEMIFQALGYVAGQGGVDAVNAILREDAIGYSFTEYVVRPTIEVKVSPAQATKLEQLQRSLGIVGTRPSPHVQFPQGIKLTNSLLHANVIVPALHFLTDPRFATANGEMLNACRHFRASDYGAAINACGQAFESVLKTILTLKSVAYDQNKDTVVKLIEHGRQHNLFPDFYVEDLKLVGIIRNKLGSHGGGPTPPYGKPDERHAEHHLHITASHILFLVRMAKL